MVMKAEPLLFVCVSGPLTTGGAAPPTFSTIPSPSGPVIMALGSHQLAAILVRFVGTADGVFLLPETELTPELVGPLGRERVLVLSTYEEYAGATRGDLDFPWAERVVDYDFPAALARRPG